MFIDAEHSHLQPAVRVLVIYLMKKFNRNKSTIANTYQCYLKRSMIDIKEDLALAAQESFKLGLKIVRGAYLEFENDRAASMRVDSPIFPTYEDTNNNYDR